MTGPRVAQLIRAEPASPSSDSKSAGPATAAHPGHGGVWGVGDRDDEPCPRGGCSPLRIKMKTEPEFASPPLSLFFHGSACWGHVTPDFYSDKNAC